MLAGGGSSRKGANDASKRAPKETASDSGDNEQELRLQDIIIPRKRREDPEDAADYSKTRLDEAAQLNRFVRLGKSTFDDRFSVLKYPQGIEDFVRARHAIRARLPVLMLNFLVSHYGDERAAVPQ